MMTDLPRLLTDWAQYLATGVAGGLVALWTTLGRRDRALGAQIDALDSRLTQTELQVATVPDRCHAHIARLASLEESLRHHPHHSDLNTLREKSEAGLLRVHERVDRIEKSLGRIEGQLGGVAENVNLLKSYLLEHGHKTADHR